MEDDQTGGTMNNLTQKGVDAWNAKEDEIIKCGKPINTPEMKKYKKENPLPTREELKEIMRKHKSSTIKR